MMIGLSSLCDLMSIVQFIILCSEVNHGMWVSSGEMIFEVDLTCTPYLFESTAKNIIRLHASE